MMKDVREGLIEKVIVYSFSRYARSVTHLLRALEEFRKVNVGFVSITESIDTNTPLGAAVFTILGAVAQLERDLIAERVRNGLANAQQIESPAYEVTPIEITETDSSALHEIEMPYGEIKLELDFAS